MLAVDNQASERCLWTVIAKPCYVYILKDILRHSITVEPLEEYLQNVEFAMIY